MLDRLYAAYNHEDAAQDPIQIVRQFDRPDDREVVGFLASGLAFGRVASVLQSIERVLAVMGPYPARFVREFDPERHGQAFSGIVHRWTRGPDLAALVWVLGRIIRDAGSIERFFVAGDDPSAPDIGPALESFSRRALEFDVSQVYGHVPSRAGVCYFFPKPSLGSGCKRLNLYLRWMVRRDRVDLGLWSGLSPSRLVVPLDVHVVRLGRCLGLTRYKSPGWKMAAEITASLRQFNASDPVRYDFALCHVGMRDECGDRRPHRDSRCPLKGFCRPGPGTPSAFPPPSGRR